MSDPLFLSEDEIVELHHDAINEFGGSHGIRDRALLQSAVEMPRASFAGEYLHPDLPAMAAALLFHLVQNHPFIDGNKRVGAAAARVFLLLNNIAFDPPPDDYAELVLATARGELDKPEIASYIRVHIRT